MDAKNQEQQLTMKQKLFTQEYILDFNGAAAAERAGYSRKSARAIAAENLTKPHIRQAIKGAVEDRVERTKVDQDKVIRNLARIAFSDIRSYYAPGNKLKDVNDLDDDAAAALAAVDIIVTGSGDNMAVIKKVRLFDKLRALYSLAKHLGLFDANNRQRWPKVIVKDFSGGRHDD